VNDVLLKVQNKNAGGKKKFSQKKKVDLP